MTELRYLPDQDHVTEFTATVQEATPEYIVLDGTYFYPEGGGQPADRGVLVWDDGEASVVDVRKDHGRIKHAIDSYTGSLPEPGTTVRARIDADRRARVTRMHTAQHVLSRVVLDEYGATTAGNQIHPERSRIDFEPARFDTTDLQAVQRQANAVIEQDLPVTKANRPRSEVEATVDEGRALLDLIPDSVDPLRVVEIQDFDVCPCGGTHVERLGEIGRIEITGRSSKGENTDRIEFTLATN